MTRFAGALVAILTALPALAQPLPQYVAGPLSGFAHDCKQAGQPVDTAAMVTRVDIDGDGKPDHLIDSRKGCKAVRDLYCTPAGACALDIYLSRTERQEASHKVLEFELTPGHGLMLVRMVMAGKECGPAASCGRVLLWRNGTLNLTR